MKIRWPFLILALLVGAASWPVLAENPGANESKVDEILVIKSKHQLELLSGGKVVKTYRVALGREPVGRKERQGDHKTPEGIFSIVGRNPNSQYHRSLRISYPTAEDRARAAKLGVSPGGDIMIHGLPNGYGWIGRGHLARDWTEGCIAVTDKEIEEIWAAVPDGAKVEIRP